MLVVGVLLAIVVRHCGGLIYGLDDTYIHMAVAKNLARHGVWGINPYEWSSPSSSPAYTLLLAIVFRIFGVNAWAPLVLNIIASVLLLTVLYSALNKHAAGLANWVKTGFLISAVLILPLPVLTLIGMEHIFHALLIVILIDKFIDLVTEKNANAQQILLFSVLSGAAIMTRYESGFLLAPMFIALLIKRKLIPALGLALGISIPVRIFSMISEAHGAMTLPNSVLLKSEAGAPLASGPGLLGPILNFMDRVYRGATIEPALLAFAAVFIIYLLRRLKPPRPVYYTGILITVTALLGHFTFVYSGVQYRYTAYLIAVCLAASIPLLKCAEQSAPRMQKRIGLALAFLVLCVFSIRAGSNLYQAPFASRNIHDQQYQMGLFLRQYYTDRPVAVNDIGAVDYLADLRTVDIVGLGNNTLARLMYCNRLSPSLYRAIIEQRHTCIAIIYDSWMYPQWRPRNWIPVCRWKIKNNYVCGDNTVTFYAANPKYETELVRNLLAFAPHLPKSVQVQYNQSASRAVK